MLFSGKIPSQVAARLDVGIGYLFASICHHSRLFVRMIRYLLFVTIRYVLFAIRYSGFPDTNVYNSYDSCEPKAERTFCFCTNLKLEIF